MDNIVQTFLILSPLKLGLIDMIEYMGILINNKSFIVSFYSIGILINILYAAILMYIYFNLDELPNVDKVTYGICLGISFVLSLISLYISYYVFKQIACINNKVNIGFGVLSLTFIENMINIIFVSYLLYKLYLSVQNSDSIVDSTDIYIWTTLVFISTLVKIIKIYIIS